MEWVYSKERGIRCNYNIQYQDVVTKKKESDLTEPEKSKNQPAVGEPVDPAVLSLRKEKDWFIVVDDISNQKCY